MVAQLITKSTSYNAICHNLNLQVRLLIYKKYQRYTNPLINSDIKSKHLLCFKSDNVNKIFVFLSYFLFFNTFKKGM